ncbi:MAG: ATP-binding protein [Alphaproteobacteria bacterium]
MSALAAFEQPHALVLAPNGRDGAVAQALLKEIGIVAANCRDLADLQRQLSADVWFVVLTEEATRAADLRFLASWIAGQPAWSDLPFILLTTHGGGVERNPTAARLSETLGNVSFLERPFHPTTFASLARSALKGRRRQYEARALLEDLRENDERLRNLAETLEGRVRERAAELERAHAQVVEQMAVRARAEEQLRHAQKLETIGQLTGGVAHDFNNLLMAVIGNLDLLRKRMPEDERLTRLVDGALQGAQRGAALTQRLLAFARKQDLATKPVDIADLIRDIKPLLDRSLTPGIELRFELAEGLPNAMIDANQVEAALLNLVVNARDAMPGGGALTIRLDAQEVEDANDMAPGAYLRLSVSDTGIGMDRETLAKAIEPFFSTKELGKGTGLGLSMAHGLAVQLRGALRLSSEPGKGTRAELWLPATRQAAARPESAAAPMAAADRRLRVLVVDDDLLIAMSTVDMLDDLGHDVTEAHSGDEALKILGDDRPFDLMITDHSMPGMTGMQLAVLARDMRPGLPILLATGYAELPDAPAIELPRLAKPYKQNQLASQIAKLVGHGV